MTGRPGVLAAVAVLLTLAEPGLGVHGYWPAGTAVLLGVGGGLALALGAKTLGAMGLQRPETPDE